MSTKNKFSKLAVLSLLGVMGLTACNNSTEEIYAKPSNYNDEIVTIVDEEGNEQDIHNNILKIIYDAIHEGSLAQEVLDNALYRYAQSIFGVYNNVVSKDSTVITLKDAWYSYTHENGAEKTTKIDQFIRAHKAYWLTDENGKHIDEEGKEVTDPNFTPCATEREKVVSKWEAIENRIAETMYTRALSGSYTVKSLFREEKFIRSLYEDGEKVAYAQAKAGGLMVPVIVPYTVEKQDIFNPYIEDPEQPTKVKYYIHREYYQDSINKTDYKECKATYVEDEIIPTVYSDLLIEQYLLDEDIAAIRNSKARKINVLKIEKYSSFTNNADMLVKELVSEIYSNKPDAAKQYVETDVDTIETWGKDLFEKYGTIAKGLYDEIANNSEALAIVTKLNGNASDVYEKVDGTLPYYKNTTYGDLVKEYNELKEDIDNNKWDDLDEDLFATYTSSGTTTIKEGFEQKKIAIQQSQNITKGWFINNNQPSLDSAGEINKNLFKLSIANAKIEIGEEGKCDPELRAENLEKLADADRWYKDGTEWKLRTAASEDENKFLCSINGAYFLKFEGQYSGDDWKNDIVYDDGSAYYIVQVLEAAKDSKLKTTIDGSYLDSRGAAFLNEVIDEAAKVLGETGNYASVSKEYWLKKMDIKYHDQVVYEYLKENYPDLFD